MQFNEWAMTDFLNRSLKLPPLMYYKPDEAGSIFHRPYDKEDDSILMIYLVYKGQEHGIKLNPYDPAHKVLENLTKESREFQNKVNGLRG